MQVDNLIDDGDFNRIMILNKSRLAQQMLSSEVTEIIDGPSNSAHVNPVDNYQTPCGETKVKELNKFSGEE